ncbi:MAG: MFS transporter [Acidobacteria bacterium]|nr:MFS transporter [Acidobacteriota bacterium]
MFRDPNFRRLWIAQTISEIGSRITREGLPLTAVFVLGGTSADMGILQAIGGFAALLAAPIAGWMADRLHRKPVMITADLGRAVLLALIPLAATQGWLSLPLLYTIVAATSILTVAFDVAYQTIVPALVRRHQLLEANSKLALTASTAEMVGPAITGFLVQALTAPRAILLDAISFLASAAFLSRLRAREEIAEKPDTNPFHDAINGIRYVLHHSLLRPLLLRDSTASFFFGFFSALYVLFAVRELGLKPAALGLIIAIGGASNFLGALLAERIGRRFQTGHILIAATAASGCIMLLIPLARGPIWGAFILAITQLLGDISYPIYSIHEITFRQKTADPALLGRVNAAMQMAFKGMWPIGALVGGFLALHIGIRGTLTLAGIGVLASALVLYFSPLRRAHTT